MKLSRRLSLGNTRATQSTNAQNTKKGDERNWETEMLKL